MFSVAFVRESNSFTSEPNPEASAEWEGGPTILEPLRCPVAMGQRGHPFFFGGLTFQGKPSPREKKKKKTGHHWATGDHLANCASEHPTRDPTACSQLDHGSVACQDSCLSVEPGLRPLHKLWPVHLTIAVLRPEALIFTSAPKSLPNISPWETLFSPCGEHPWGHFSHVKNTPRSFVGSGFPWSLVTPR